MSSLSLKWESEVKILRAWQGVEQKANRAWLQALSGYCRGEPIVFPFQGSRPVLANSDPGNYNFCFTEGESAWRGRGQ